MVTDLKRGQEYRAPSLVLQNNFCEIQKTDFLGAKEIINNIGIDFCNLNKVRVFILDK